MAALTAFGGAGVAHAQTTPTVEGYNETQTRGVVGVVGEVSSPPTAPQSQSAPSRGVTEEGADVAPESDAAPVSAAQPVEEGELPFTGLDLGIVVLMGLALLGTGFVLRRSMRTDSA